MAVWLLRSGSLAASSVGERRSRRGVKWYDGIQVLLAAPWHVVAVFGGFVVSTTSIGVSPHTYVTSLQDFFYMKDLVSGLVKAVIFGGIIGGSADHHHYPYAHHYPYGHHAPYYAPAPVEIAFLEDFAGLARALRMVRPMVFFAVPRIYERVLQATQASAVGRRFLAMPEGWPKRLLRPGVRRRLLRRGGLDRCAQLLIGSAPAAETMLRAFRDVGIEVHDAYGLTEAPLVTLNRSGRNRLGTAGEPLPETRLRIAEDGEILVRGPQVMAGYVDEGSAQPFEDGWLLTGDLGHLTAEGALVINGRKKDLLKTAYGKYLNPAKVESMLRAIPDVTEAMVIGEGRPFCTALVWAEPPLTPERVVAIDVAVEDVNRQLSQPEQVRRWAIEEYDLSVAGGELTPNLKLKRAKIAERYATKIEGLYSAAMSPAPREVSPA